MKYYKKKNFCHIHFFALIYCRLTEVNSEPRRTRETDREREEEEEEELEERRRDSEED